MKKAVTLNEVFPLINEQLLAGGSASFITHGISMKPLLRDGCDTVYLEKPKGKIKKYDVVFYLSGEHFTLHRVVKLNGGLICRGDNQTQNESPIDESEIIAIMTHYERNGKKRSVGSVGYIIYSRIWVNTVFLRKCTRKLLSVFRRNKK